MANDDIMNLIFKIKAGYELTDADMDAINELINMLATEEPEHTKEEITASIKQFGKAIKRARDGKEAEQFLRELFGKYHEGTKE